jgi:prolyl-tRNA editing enzyme YbaK/EbsC (Cys-tRNA(Pro) deacylase)
MTSSLGENDVLSEYARSVEIAREAVRNALHNAGLNPEYRVLPTDVPSGAHRVDPLLVAPLFGANKLKRADAETALRATGQHVGGCAPCGHPAPLRIVVDESLRKHSELWVSGGDKATVMRLTFDELVLLTGGQVANIAMHA